MKKIILSIFIVVFALSLNAQQQGKIRVGLDGGIGMPNAGLGFNGDLDIRYNIMDNLNLGVKFGLTALAKDIVGSGSNYTATASAMTSSLITGDYYFNKPASSFAPFLGGGLGSFSIGNMLITSEDQSTTVPAGLLIEHKIGGLLRGGFESGHFRMALEYYLVPSSSVVDLNNVYVKTTGNSFLNLSIGFYMGGGKWKK